MMAFPRLIKHLLTTRLNVRRHFPQHCLDAIKAAIEQAETVHKGEIRFAIETALQPAQLISGMTPRKRAVEVFSESRIWDTEHNGVLIYMLLADKAVEVVADRGIHAKTGGKEVWQTIIDSMQNSFAWLSLRPVRCTAYERWLEN